MNTHNIHVCAKLLHQNTDGFGAAFGCGTMEGRPSIIISASSTHDELPPRKTGYISAGTHCSGVEICTAATHCANVCAELHQHAYNVNVAFPPRPGEGASSRRPIEKLRRARQIPSPKHAPHRRGRQWRRCEVATNYFSPCPRPRGVPPTRSLRWLGFQQASLVCCKKGPFR